MKGPVRWPKLFCTGGLLCLLLSGALRAAEPSSQESPVTPLGELEPLSARQDWGSLAVNQSVWGKPLQIGDRRFASGLGTHANSELVYELGRAFDRFEAWVGVDAAMRQHPEASVVFKVVADGRELFNSGVMRAHSPAQRVSLAVKDATELKLVVTDADDGINADHADWAEAVLIGKGKPPAPWPPPRPAKFTVRAPSLELRLSARGEIVGASMGSAGLPRPLQGGTELARCTNAGPVSARELAGGGVEFTRQIVHGPSGRRAALTERFLPSKDSVRWEVEIHGDSAPWSTGLETRLWWPATNTTRFWTAGADPEQPRDVWRDPLLLHPLVNQRLGYGDGFVIPLLTLAEPEQNLGLSLALSPEDPLLEMTLTAHRNGLFLFTRNDHRLSQTNTARFALDLVAHEAGWRGGLRWMTQRYPEFFNPPNPRARELAGLGAYSDWEGALEAAKFRRMGFRVNWKASYDFPYMGMFLPPIADDAKYPRLAKGNQTSIAQLRDYSSRMRRLGFHVLNYFNATEFGATTGQPKDADPKLSPADRWKNVHNFMREDVADGILLDPQGRRYGSWEGCVAMDCAAPKYRAFLLEQARRHIDKLPDSDGICIDRLDWLRLYNLRADDGQSWRGNQPCRSLYLSWRSLLAELGPMFHQADKIILVNALINRTELLRHVDGIYHEMGHVPAALNGAALQCVLKPCIAWTPDESALKPDPDAYFQRHLHLGVFPTAPLPANDHTINPSAWADRWYLDYGPLMDALRARQWVLAAHCVEAVTPGVKVNLFQTPEGYALPVTFGGRAESATVRVRHVNGLANVHCQALHPGAATPVPVPAAFSHNELELQVPLERGCALVQLKTGGTKSP